MITEVSTTVANESHNELTWRPSDHAMLRDFSERAGPTVAAAVREHLLAETTTLHYH